MENKRATNKDVAALAGVSVATVSYVINGKADHISEITKKKVMQAVNFLGYSPNLYASSLKTNSARSIVVRSNSSFSSFWDIEIASLTRELSNVSEEKGYNIFFSPDTKAEKLSHEACICINMKEQDFRTLAEENFVPLLTVDALLNDPVFYQITTDYEKINAKANEFFKGNDYVYLALTPSCEQLKKEIETVFENVVFISNIKDIAYLKPSFKNITISQTALNELKPLLNNYNIFHYQSQDKARKILDCAANAIARVNVPDKEHFVKV
ncbi:MAG: LacI family transcriptional regulator [Firmicutes bacterium]|nr:LacI family transcriptional regulator [Bacillota bacterium]